MMTPIILLSVVGMALSAAAQPNVVFFLVDDLGYSEDRKNPFFLMLAFYMVHTPIQPKPALKKKRSRKR